MSNAPNVPTAPSDEAPYFLDSEFHEPAQVGARVYVSTVATAKAGRIRVVGRLNADDEDESRRRAWLTCCALNASHMAAETRWNEEDELVASGPFGTVSLERDEAAVWLSINRSGLADLDRETAAALGLALVEFAATGKLPGETP